MSAVDKGAANKDERIPQGAVGAEAPLEDMSIRRLCMLREEIQTVTNRESIRQGERDSCRESSGKKKSSISPRSARKNSVANTRNYKRRREVKRGGWSRKEAKCRRTKGVGLSGLEMCPDAWPGEIRYKRRC